MTQQEFEPGFFRFKANPKTATLSWLSSGFSWYSEILIFVIHLSQVSYQHFCLEMGEHHRICLKLSRRLWTLQVIPKAWRLWQGFFYKCKLLLSAPLYAILYMLTRKKVPLGTPRYVCRSHWVLPGKAAGKLQPYSCTTELKILTVLEDFLHLSWNSFLSA